MKMKQRKHRDIEAPIEQSKKKNERKLKEKTSAFHGTSENKNE